MATLEELEGNGTFVMKVIDHISVGGQIVAPGALIEVDRAEAVDLLNRGKAELATEADHGIAAMCASIVAAAESGKEEAAGETAEEPAGNAEEKPTE